VQTLIAHLTDLHIRPPGKLAYRVAETNVLSGRAIDAIGALAPKPDCAIISGDLTDGGKPSEYQLLRTMLARLTIPVFLIPGNHDRRENLKAAFSDYPGMAQNDQYVQYAVDCGPLRLVGLDTVVPEEHHGALRPQQLDWLAAELARDRQRPTIIFMHHPPFACGIQHMDEIRLLAGADALADIISQNPQVERVLCGHHHRPIHMRWAGTIASTGPSVAHQVQLDLLPAAAGALVLEPPAYQLHGYIEHTGLITHMAYVERFAGPYPFLSDLD
jgi:3',5'-cyclic-AMP phosphodiesterase